MPDGKRLDLGDNPSPELKAKVAAKIKSMREAQPTTTTSTTPSVTSTSQKEFSPEAAAAGKTWVAGQGAPVGPSVVRMGSQLVGGVLGGGAAIALGQPELAPAGARAGAAAFATAGDWAAQHMEMSEGLRSEYNPYRTLAEAGSAGIFAGNPVGDSILESVVANGSLGVVSQTAIDLADGKGIPTPGEAAISFLTAGGLAATGKYFDVRRSALKEVSGTPEVASHVEAMIHPDSSGVGPDGAPTEIPPTGSAEYYRWKPKGAPPAPEAPPPDVAGPPVSSETPMSVAGDTPALETAPKPDLAASDAKMKESVGATPVKNRKALGSPMEQLFAEDGGISDLQDQANGAQKGMPGDKGSLDTASDYTKNFVKYFGYPKNYADRLERETKYPIYQDYNQLDQYNKEFQGKLKPITKAAYSVLKGTDASEQGEIAAGLTAGGDLSGIDPAVRGKVDKLRGVLDEALSPYNVTSDQYWGEYVPAKVNDQPIDPKFKFLDSAVEAGRINPMNPNIPQQVAGIIKSGVYDDTMGPFIGTLEQKYQDTRIPGSVREMANWMTSAVKGSPDVVTKAVGSAVDHWFNQMAGLDIDGRNVVSRISNTAYSAILGLRPGTVVRAALHTLQTAVGHLNPVWTAEGYRQMATDAGRMLVERSGVVADSLLEKLQNMGDNSVGAIFDRRISDTMLPFGAVKNFSRGAVYLGQRAKTLAAAEASGGDMETFMRLSGAIKFNKNDANQIRQLFATGDTDEAAHLAGQIVVDRTQPAHDALEAPRILNAPGAGIALPLARWPYAVAHSLTSMFEKGGGATNADIAKSLGWWITGNAATGGTLYGLGKLFGSPNAAQSALGYTFVSPMMYTGSPFMNFLYDQAKAVKSMTSGGPFLGTQKSMATPEMKKAFRDWMNVAVPAGSAIGDIVKARKEATPMAAAGRILGFKQGPTPRQKSGAKSFGGSFAPPAQGTSPWSRGFGK